MYAFSSINSLHCIKQVNISDEYNSLMLMMFLYPSNNGPNNV